MIQGESAIEGIVKKIEESADKEGYTFGEHVTEMINRILQNPKEYSLSNFEDLSYLIKLSRLKLKQPLQDKQVRCLQKKFTEKQEWAERFEKQIKDVVYISSLICL